MRPRALLPRAFRPSDLAARSTRRLDGLDMAELVVTFVYRFAILAGPQITLDRLFHRFKDLGVANRLFDVGGRNHDDSVGVPVNRIAGHDVDLRPGLSGERYRDVHSGERPKSLGRLRRRESSEYGQREFTELRQVPHATIDHHGFASAQFPTQCNVAADRCADAIRATRNDHDATVAYMTIHLEHWFRCAGPGRGLRAVAAGEAKRWPGDDCRYAEGANRRRQDLVRQPHGAQDVAQHGDRKLSKAPIHTGVTVQFALLISDRTR